MSTSNSYATSHWLLWCTERLVYYYLLAIVMPGFTHTHKHTADFIAFIYLYPPTLEVSHHVSALRNLWGPVQAHVGVLTINHVLLEWKEKNSYSNDWCSYVALNSALHFICCLELLTSSDQWILSKNVNIKQLSYAISVFIGWFSKELKLLLIKVWQKEKTRKKNWTKLCTEFMNKVFEYIKLHQWTLLDHL